MQQELGMEKKLMIRAVQPQLKGAPTDSKKSQDAAGSRVGARGGRSVSGSSSKQPNQRNKTGCDKWPRQRGLSGYVGGKANARVENELAEQGIFKQGRKKQSLNHLLNFHYAPREHVVGFKGYQHHHKHHYPKYNKEQFLQANCQFVVRSGPDYTLSLSDPDALVDWMFIEQILVKSEQAPNCPICLDSLLAGRITRCGHVYCYPCLLHYLALSDKAWRKCPICYEAVHIKDVKSVSWVPLGSFNVGDVISLQLMRRARNSLQPVPVGLKCFIQNGSPPNVNQSPDIIQHCKLLQAEPHQVLEIINRDIQSLQDAYVSEVDTPEACFIEQALEHLQIKKKDLLEAPLMTSVNEEKATALIDEVGETVDAGDEKIFKDEVVITEESLDVSTADISYEDVLKDEFADEIIEDGAVGVPIDNDFYFYQAADGQHIYLAGLNARVLERSYGGPLSQCPSILTGTVEAREVVTVTNEFRKRVRYLQHLPVTCQIELVELQLRPPLVTREALEFYHVQLEERRKSHLRKSREEKRHDQRVSLEVMKQQGLLLPSEAPAKMELQSSSHFPQCGSPESLTGLLSQLGDRDEESSCSDVASSPKGPSFAKMLSSKPLRPSFSGSSRSQNIPTSTKKVAAAASTDSDPDDYSAAPSYTQSFSDAIAQALDRAFISHQQVSDSHDENGSKKKKKKQKQKVLFATGMNFHS